MTWALRVYLNVGISLHKNSGYRVVIYIPVLTVETQRVTGTRLHSNASPQGI